VRLKVTTPQFAHGVRFSPPRYAPFTLYSLLLTEFRHA